MATFSPQEAEKRLANVLQIPLNQTQTPITLEIESTNQGKEK